MKRPGMIILIVCFVLTILTPAFLYGKTLRWKRPAIGLQSDVTGVVECANQEPVSRALVYFVGESFMAKTDEEGRFTFRSVPPGSYNLEIQIMDNIIEQVPVEISKRRTIDLGFIDVDCPSLTVTCRSNNECAEGTYCEKNNGQCDSGAIGRCVPVPLNSVPLNCPEEYAPVCGCDWKTYSNRCLAEESGVNVRFEGSCDAY